MFFLKPNTFFAALLLVPCLLWGGYEEPWGKDAFLAKPSEVEEPSRSLLVRGAQRVILFHQQVISPVDGPRSSFRPTSCRYMYHAMRRYGFWNGFLMGCDRLMRENSDPWVYRTKKIGGVLYKWDPPRLEGAKSFSLSSREALPCSLKIIGEPEN